MRLSHPSELRRVIPILIIAMFGVVEAVNLAVAQEVPEKEINARTLEQMTARWQKLRAFLQIDGQEMEIDRLEKPISNYSESTRESSHYGTLWVWTTTGRPVAVLAQSKSYGESIWGYELAALSEGVSVVMHDDWRWSPRSALKMTPFPNAPPVAGSAVARLRQIKDLARRCAVSEMYFNEPFELRMLPSPIYRYQDDRAAVIDGALFSFAHGTNPEAVVVIECRQQQTESVWSYGFLPFGGAALTGKLDGTTVWSKEATRETRAQELYSTWLESEPAE
jgi:hypothetical protein